MLAIAVLRHAWTSFMQISRASWRGRNNIHLRVEKARRSFNDGSLAFVHHNLVHLVRSTGHHSGELQLHILRLHVENERVGEALGLAGLDGMVVLYGGQVVKDALILGRALGERLGVGDEASQESDLDRAILVVGELDQSCCRVAVDEAHAQDVGIGKCRFHAGLELGLRRGSAIVGGSGIISLNRTGMLVLLTTFSP